MAAAPSSAKSRHHECAMCMETFTSPRLLPCFHTFCLGCLKQLLQHHHKTNSFSCPTCKTYIDIPPGGVDKFQVNFYVEAEAEAKRAGSETIRTCEMCGKGPSTHKCSDCDQFACDSCTAIHATIKATKSHTVLSLHNTTASGKNSASSVIKERYCSTHKEEKIRFFCTKCSTVICRDCKLTAHENHKTTDLSQKSSEARKLVLEITERTDRNLDPKLRKMLEQAEKQKRDVQESKKTIEKTIEKRAKQLKKEIDKSVARAKTELNQETDVTDKLVSRCIDSMTQELTCFLSLTEHARCLAKSGCDADVLEMPTQIKSFFGDSFTSEEQKLVRCMHCTYQKKNTQKFCPSCGLKGFALRPTSCKNCAFQLVDNIQFCPKCGHDQTATHTPDASDCKLKSFTIDEWRLNVQIDVAKGCRECKNCLCQYSQEMKSCPECGTKEPGHHEQCEYCGVSLRPDQQFCSNCGRQKSARSVQTCNSIAADYVQCGKCGHMYSQNRNPCPGCGTQSHADVSASIEKIIPQYIGRVTKIHQSQHSTDTKSRKVEGFLDSSYERQQIDYGVRHTSQQRASRRKFLCEQIASKRRSRLQQGDLLVQTGTDEITPGGHQQTSTDEMAPRGHHQTGTDGLASEISTEISAIQSLLARWQMTNT